MIHLLPSTNSIFGGFFGVCPDAPGVAFPSGGPLFAESGTTPLDRSSGFLCVIWDESTLRSPDVADPPRFSSESRAAAEPGPAGANEGESAGGGGGGGGAEEPVGAELIFVMDDGAGEPLFE